MADPRARLEPADPKLNPPTRHELRRLAELSPGIALCGFRLAAAQRRTFPFVSPAAAELLGADPTLLAMDAAPFFARIGLEDAFRIRDGLRNSIETLSPWQDHWCYQHPRKGEVWLEANWTPQREADGSLLWTGTLADITHHKNRERTLRQNADYYRSMVQSVSQVGWTCGPDGEDEYVSNTWLEYTGISRKHLTQAAWLDSIHPDDREGADAAWQQAVITESTYRIQVRIRRFDGVYRWFDVRGNPMRDADGRLIRWFGTSHDIHDERNLRAQLREEKERAALVAQELKLRSEALETSLTAFGIVREGKFIYANRTYLRMWGYDRLEEIVGTSPAGHCVDPTIPRRIIEAVERDGHCILEFEALRRDRSTFQVRMEMQSTRDSDGVPTYFGTALDVTDERRAAEITRKWADAFTHCGHGIAMGATATNTLIVCNPAFARLVGRSPADLAGRQIIDLYPPDQRDGVLACLAQADRTGHSRMETQYLRPDGIPVDVQVDLVTVREVDGTPLYRVATAQSITDRKVTEASLRTTRDQLQAIDRASPIPIIAISPSGTVFHWNLAAELLFGWKAQEVLGKPLPIVPLEKEAEYFRFRSRVVGGESFTEVSQRVTRDGRLLDVQISTSPLFNVERECLGFVALYVDLTQHKALERALKASEERFSMAFEASPSGSILIRGSDQRIIEANQAMEKLSGYSRDQLVGRSTAELPYFVDLTTRQKLWDLLRSEGRVTQLEYPFRRADGAIRRAQASAELLQMNGEAMVLGVLQDVTEQREAETALRESEARFRQLAESIHEVFWLTDIAKGTIVYISPGYESIWGRSCEQLYRQPSDWVDAIHPEDRDRVRQASMTKQSNGTYDEEYRIVRPDGSIRWIRDRAFPVRSSEGVVTRVAGVAEDITNRRQLESQVLQTQKMESVGLLAGGVAHDFNNWLTVISGSTELLMMEIPETEGGHHELLQEIKFASERATALTRQLLAFSRREVVEPRVMDLNTIIIDTEKMLRRLLGEDVQLETSLAAGLGWVKIDPGQWTQVLMNLAVNARDAMPTGGRLSMSTRLQTLDEGFTQRRAPLQPGEYVALAVTDTGCGMPPEVRSRVFEPFFTTKGMGKGTGLGLAVVHGIVTQSGGSIEVESEPGAGTTFRIYLPVADEVARSSSSAAATFNLKGSETVLLVEDEESIRRVACQGLRAQGYNVLQAGDGEEALKVLNRHGKAIDLLVTDVVMPRMSGRLLAEAVKDRYPSVKVLYTSGYTDDAVVRHGVLQAEVAFLSKPYTPMILLRRIRQVLEAPPAVPPLPSAGQPRS